MHHVAPSSIKVSGETRYNVFALGALGGVIVGKLIPRGASLSFSLACAAIGLGCNEASTA